MAMLHIVVALATVNILQSTAQECPHYGEIEQSSSDNSVSICLPDASTGSFRWTKICADGWTLTHARLTCRQLNLGFQGASITSVSVVLRTPCVSLPGCRGTERNLTECGDGSIVTGLTSTALAAVNCSCVHGNVRLESSTDPTQMNALVQFCHFGEWRSICVDSGWGPNDATVLCNQLGYRRGGATRGFVCQSENINGYIREVSCRDLPPMLSECRYESDGNCNENCGAQKFHAAIRCSPDNCATGRVRLVNGSTNREGRVEVCVDGRWGTVCNNNQGIAGAACSQLGYPPEGAVPRKFSLGATPLYICNLNGTNFSCTPTNDVTCDRPVGVECLLEEVVNQLNNNLKASCPPSVTGSMSGVDALGAVVGLLLIVLVVLVIGWSLSCVALVKRNSHSQKQKQFRTNSNPMETTEHQLDNPVYDTNMETHTYSSSGPTYELADTVEGVGQTYSVLEQCQERAIPLKTGTGVCAYEVPVSGQTNNQVKVCEEEYSTLQH